MENPNATVSLQDLLSLMIERIKQLTEDPWKIFKDQHNVGDKIEVEVVKVAEFGVFVKVFDTIEGLVHKTEFEDNKEYQPGDKLEVIIKSISDTDRKVSLSVKAVSDEENQKIVEEAEAVTEKVPEKLGSMAAAFKAAEEKAEEKAE